MSELQPGQMVGPFRIIEPVGHGGMATVYKAYHAAMDRYVAVKIIPFQFAEKAGFIDRFRREVRVIAQLEHPHILPVYDSGEHGDLPYLVMRYLDTGTLKERMESRSLSPAETTRILTQLASALGYAHDHGIVHRDVKPANVLLSKRNDVFLTDFGIAKAVEESTSEFTAAGAITGTPAYMSPEQAQGEKLDGRSDIYALGIMLYEMVTGQVPFEAETPLAVILKHLQAPLPLPSTIKPDIQPGVERVLLKALAKNPNDRYASMADLAAAWLAAQREGQSAAAPAGPSRQTAAAVPAGPAERASMPVTTAIEAPLAGSAQVAAPANEVAEPDSATRGRRWPLWLALGGIGFLALIALFAIGALIISNLLNPDESGGDNGSVADNAPGEINNSDRDVVDQGEAAETDGVDPDSGPGTDADFADYIGVALQNGAYFWETWAPINEVYAIAASDRALLAGGPGGLTIWSPNQDGYEHFPLPAQLDEPAVFDIAVDDDGVIWLATNGGVVRFDGVRWTVYDESDGLDSPYIRAVTIWDGLVIAGSHYSYPGGGINVFDGSGWSLNAGFPSGDDENDVSYDVNAITVTPDGAVWVGTTRGVAVLADDEWTILPLEDVLPEAYVNVIYYGSDEAILIGSDAGAARISGDEITAIETLAEKTVLGIEQDARGQYWFSADGGLFRLNAELADWEFISRDSGALPTYGIGGIWRGPAGRLYVASDSGIILFDGAEFTQRQMPGMPALEETSMVFLNPTESAHVWFAEPYAERTDIFDRENEIWLTSPDIECSPLGFDEAGRLWCKDGRLLIVDAAETIVLGEDNGLPAATITGLAVTPAGPAWLGTEAGLVVIENDTITDFRPASDFGLADPEIWTISAGTTSDAWFGNRGGLVHINDDRSYDTYTIGDPFTEAFAGVIALAVSTDEVVWVGTYGDGLWRYEDGDWTQFEPEMRGVGLPDVDVMALAATDSGGVWAATYDGVTYFDGQTWYLFDREDGLLSRSINAIFQDDWGDIWFAGYGGVTRLVIE